MNDVSSLQPRPTTPRLPFTSAVFDMDGLLLDSEREVRDAWLRAASSLNNPLAEADYLSVVGLNHADSRVRMLMLFKDDHDLLMRTHTQVEADLHDRFGQRAFALKPGALRLLQTLQRASIPCAVASSTHRDEVLRRLGNADILDYFVAVCGGDEVARGKPAPDLYLLALDRLGASAAGSIAFEDSGHGAQAALAAGMSVVNVPDLKAPEIAVQVRCLAVLPSLERVCDHSVEWFGIQCA